MRQQRSITGRHVAFAVLVLIVVNAQLTWWIIYSTRQARDRLGLERALLETQARAWVEMAAAECGVDESSPPEGLEIVAEPLTDDGRPVIAIAGDSAGRVVRPTEDAWGAILKEYRRRIVMMVSEGAFFAVLLVVFMGLMWRTFRREVELERQHRNFLSAITHELKSPIAAIKVALETVLSGRADERMAGKFIGNALADTDRLDQLVQKVLHVTRYGSRAAVYRRSRQSLADIVEQVVVAFEPGAVAAGAVVVADIDQDAWAEIDGEAMAIVVSNLLENALKYGGKPAEIRVALRRESKSVVLEVTDNGRGIAESEVPLIFDRFYRTGDEMTRTSQGTGLGLHLVQTIVMAHHGSVNVTQTGPDGTTLRVTVPETGESLQ